MQPLGIPTAARKPNATSRYPQTVLHCHTYQVAVCCISLQQSRTPHFKVEIVKNCKKKYTTLATESMGAAGLWGYFYLVFSVLTAESTLTLLWQVKREQLCLSHPHSRGAASQFLTAIGTGSSPLSNQSASSAFPDSPPNEEVQKVLLFPRIIKIASKSHLNRKWSLRTFQLSKAFKDGF